jgi:transmembrane sensor
MTMPAEEEDRATLEAARWLVALEEEPDDADLCARIAAWRAASPANELAWVNTSDIYGLMATAAPERHAPVVRPSFRRPFFNHRAYAGAIGLALAACVALVVGPGLLLRLQADQVTSTAEVRPLHLDDGSIVHLGPDSAIEVAYAEGRRGIRLLKGEAFFEVTPDPRRPFSVVAGDVETVVLGTSFNVRFVGSSAEVTVKTGLVRVDNTAASPPVGLRLEPGDWAQVGWSGKVERGAIPPEEVAPWLHGQIVARDRPMADVVDELRRYTPGAIVIADGALRGRRVTGVYNLADPVAALRAIVGAHGGSVRQVSPWVLVAF